MASPLLNSVSTQSVTRQHQPRRQHGDPAQYGPIWILGPLRCYCGLHRCTGPASPFGMVRAFPKHGAFILAVAIGRSAFVYFVSARERFERSSKIAQTHAFDSYVRAPGEGESLFGTVGNSG
ncbi:bifunctional protein FolD [Anopheles sinensis]|uniref:Bifunctional protein FolD n=1 Tax=Anopheles sinensis TaxID=74873 RepID=A0A084VRA7_ANOSI|nr:bifunctional protein FolD [Anopheles sinensis]